MLHIHQNSLKLSIRKYQDCIQNRISNSL